MSGKAKIDGENLEYYVYFNLFFFSFRFFFLIFLFYFELSESGF